MDKIVNTINKRSQKDKEFPAQILKGDFIPKAWFQQVVMILTISNQILTLLARERLIIPDFKQRHLTWDRIK